MATPFCHDFIFEIWMFCDFHFYFRAPAQVHQLKCTCRVFVRHVGILKPRKVLFFDFYRSPDPPLPPRRPTSPPRPLPTPPEVMLQLQQELRHQLLM